ncbi:hypothetical protein [Rhodovarius crocodyli]|nr:hypothetical protein [Rhodovarius crocodyli]
MFEASLIKEYRGKAAILARTEAGQVLFFVGTTLHRISVGH